MSDLEVTFMGLDEARERWRKAPEIVKDEMIKGVDRVVAIGFTVSKSIVPVGVSRNLSRSLIQLPARVTADGVQGAWRAGPPSAGAYADVMERGRRPGAPMPPQGVLLGWMAAKGIPADREFVIRRAIGRKGIVGKHYMEKGRIEVQQRIRGEFTNVRDRIVARMGG